MNKTCINVIFKTRLILIDSRAGQSDPRAHALVQSDD